jgi:hypothetical protein
MAGQLSDGTTVFASNLSVGGLDANGALFGAVSVKHLSGLSGVATSALTATSRITTAILHVGGGPVLSAGSADFRTNAVILSLATSANDSGRTIGQITLVFAASGISLMYSSGKTTYTIGGSAVSAAQG